MVWSGQIAGDGSIPRWSASKPQAVTRRKATGVFRLPVVIRIPAGLLGSLKCDPPKGNGRRQKKKCDLESSAAGATVRIAVVVQTGCGFLSGGRRGASLEDREDCFGRATVALTKAIRHTHIVSPIDMAGRDGMALTLAVLSLRVPHSQKQTGPTS